MTISNILAKRKNNGTDIISTCVPSSLLKYKKRNNIHHKHKEDKSKCIYLPDFKKDRYVDAFAFHFYFISQIYVCIFTF